jgi:phosphopentomutase
VISVGKINDIFAGHGISATLKANGIEGLVAATLSALAAAPAPAPALIYTNLVDFDQEFGHRRDVAGYADAIERFDRLLPSLQAALNPDDLLVLTADHGNDPTWRGSDHTREHVPVLLLGQSLSPACVGIRASFADLAQTFAGVFQLPAMPAGTAFALR